MLVEGEDILCLKKSNNKYMLLHGFEGNKGLINHSYFQSFIKIAQVVKRTIHINQKVQIVHREK